MEIKKTIGMICLIGLIIASIYMATTQTDKQPQKLIDDSEFEDINISIMNTSNDTLWIMQYIPTVPMLHVRCEHDILNAETYSVFFWVGVECARLEADSNPMRLNETYFNYSMCFEVQDMKIGRC